METLRQVLGGIVILGSLFAASVFANIALAATNSYDRNAARSQMTTSMEGTSDTSAATPDQVRQWGRSSGMQPLIDSLGSTTTQALNIPVLFGVERAHLTMNFGDPRSGGRSHEGLDIMAPSGTPIASPLDAVVLSTGSWAGAGYYVYTAVAGGETFVYMHLDQPSALKPGEKIARGALIGFVGNTGNASGGAAHLHFEIRANGAATDPYPRLVSAFSLAEKLNFLGPIINVKSDQAAFGNFLVANFSDEFAVAKAQNIILPPVIITALSNISVVSSFVPIRNLTIGARGTDVIWFQNYLIGVRTGPAAIALATAGATGYFGPMTQRALAEYQKSVNIAPAVGYFGPVTRAYLQSVVH